MKSFEMHSTLNPTRWAQYKAVSHAKMLERIKAAYSMVFNEPVDFDTQDNRCYRFKVDGQVRGHIILKEIPQNA